MMALYWYFVIGMLWAVFYVNSVVKFVRDNKLRKIVQVDDGCITPLLIVIAFHKDNEQLISREKRLVFWVSIMSLIYEAVFWPSHASNYIINLRGKL